MPRSPHCKGRSVRNATEQTALESPRPVRSCGQLIRNPVLSFSHPPLCPPASVALTVDTTAVGRVACFFTVPPPGFTPPLRHTHARLPVHGRGGVLGETGNSFWPLLEPSHRPQVHVRLCHRGGRWPLLLCLLQQCTRPFSPFVFSFEGPLHFHASLWCLSGEISRSSSSLSPPL